ncbi:uncharacterized protein AKAW2_21377S [Aspergillus luchuensis]|uniref:Uncharacterized protein n=1 Tax=Aspergillus kawachii TaxID=1069201 RepID=A0A7R7ZX61_ASPKA|nr:uncharacterized protein AKAW2_21377S [Aspergillus luchuensis]BCR96437.1 hypothetical protein AKAW2_21377S [Aspergillus luchuensis]GAA82380.1 hypothetical protein AKAW_00495 [Aspergillus luchuensis IFO 4308]
MSSIFCCPSINPYRPRKLDHEDKFEAFMQWTKLESSPTLDLASVGADTVPYAVQLVKQVNFGPQESIRYFAPAGTGSQFVEVAEGDLIDWNFEKLNSYKNFRCEKHNKFYEVNLYQRNPTISHHWRVNLARPSRDIDLALRTEEHQMKEIRVGIESSEYKADLSQGEASVRKQHDPIARSLEDIPAKGTDSKSPEMIPPAADPDNLALKSVLRFLLPPDRISLRSNHLLSLLCLDWLNQKFDLGLKLEPSWTSGLTSSNMIVFLCGCFDSSVDDEVDVAEVEALVIPAMKESKLTTRQRVSGRDRLKQIVTRVLDYGIGVDWVSKHGGHVRRVLDSFPSADFLEESLRANEKYEGGWSHQDASVIQSAPNEELDEESSVWSSPSDNYYPQHEIYDYGYGSESPKDFTACDKECGYCGHCDY